jgi:hypothetical protein
MFRSATGISPPPRSIILIATQPRHPSFGFPTWARSSSASNREALSLCPVAD